MDMKVIKSEAEHEAALTRIEGLMDANPDSPEEGELELLALLVEKYEGERCPIAVSYTHLTLPTILLV